MTTDTGILERIERSVAAVSDPEFPGVTIAELGILEDVRVEAGRIIIELVPTFLGCPALTTIASDVRAAADACAPSQDIEVVFLAEPAWTVDRISPSGRRKLASQFTVAVPQRRQVVCPVCGGIHIEERSPFGPTACRTISYCPQCRNPIEVMKA